MYWKIEAMAIMQTTCDSIFALTNLKEPDTLLPEIK